MMALVIQLDATISLAMKYVIQKGRTFYFQRRVPDVLRHLYGGKRTHIESLQTADPLVAARKARELARNPKRSKSAKFNTKLMGQHDPF